MLLLNSRSAAIWLILLLLTLFSTESLALSDSEHLLATAVLLVAFAKVRLIGLEFMELRFAPLPLRLLFEGWVLGCFCLLVGLYWQSVLQSAG